MWKNVWTVTRQEDGRPLYSVWDEESHANNWMAKYGGTKKLVQLFIEGELVEV